MSLSFLYSFKLKDDIQHFDRLPLNIQVDIEKHIVDVIYESFVKTGDQDYLTARLLAQKNLHRAFYWASSQSIEKYLKAFLLMRGISVDDKKFNGHAIVALYKEALADDCELQSIEMKPHSELVIDSEVNKHLKTMSVETFLKDIETHGRPDNRYNSFGVDFNTAHLFALDNFAYAIRSKIGVPSIEESFRKVDEDLIRLFENYNPWFKTKENEIYEQIPNENCRIKISGSVTALDYLISDNGSSASIYALEWLAKKMKLPKIAKQKLLDKKSKKK